MLTWTYIVVLEVYGKHDFKLFIIAWAYPL